MIMKYNRKLILEDGQEYYGYAFGDTADSAVSYTHLTLPTILLV